MQDRAAPPGAGDGHISQPAFLLQARQPAFIERTLAGEYAFLPAGQEHVVELQPLGAVHGHDRDLFGIVGGLVVHHQADMFQEIAERFVFLHGPRQLDQVFQPPRAFGGLFSLQRGGIAAFVQQGADQFSRGRGLRQVPPAGNIAHEGQQRIARARGQLIGIGNLDRRQAQRHAPHPRVAVQLFQRLVAQAALWRVIDPFKGQIVARLGDQPQIGEGIPDFGAFVKAEAADNLIAHADRNEPVLEFAGLELGADQDRRLVQASAFPLKPLNLIAHAAGFLGRVPHPDHADLVAPVALGPQCLAQALAIGVDQAGSRGEDVRRGAIILLQLDDLRARKILFELEDIGNFCAAP